MIFDGLPINHNLKQLKNHFHLLIVLIVILVLIFKCCAFNNVIKVKDL